MHEPRVDLDAHPKRAKVRLRIHMSAAAEAVRRGWPRPLEARTEAELTTLSLGPDQWLLVSDQLSAQHLIERCGIDLLGVRHLAVDVSAALLCISVQGPKASSLLGMGAGIDWSVPCTRARFAAIAAVTHRHADDCFDLYYDRAVRDYLEQWFAHALRDPLLRDAPGRAAR